MTYEDFINKTSEIIQNEIITSILNDTSSELERYGNVVKSRPEYMQALKLTIKSILFNVNDKKELIDLATGCGKSTTLINAISYVNSTKLNHIDNIDCIRGTLILKLQINDCEETVNAINKKAGKIVAYAYHSGEDKYGKPKNHINLEKLKTFPVVVLTHEGFITLTSKMQKSRITNWVNDNNKLFERKRLIIDEEIANVKMIEVSYRDLTDMENIFAAEEDESIVNTFDYYIKELKQKFLEKTTIDLNVLQYFSFKNDVDAEKNLRKYIKSKLKWNSSVLFNKIATLIKIGGYLKNRYQNDEKKKFITYSKIDIGDNYYVTQLDATSCINHLYDINSDFLKIKLPKVKSYSNTTIHIYNKFTGSKSSINDHVKKAERHISRIFDDNKINFIDAVHIDIIDKTKYKENVLLVFNSKEVEDVFSNRFRERNGFDTIKDKDYYFCDVNDKIEKVHFGELNGKNSWANCDKCYIIGLPFYSYAHYPLYYLAYNSQIDDNFLKDFGNITFTTLTGAKRFTDEQFEKVRLGLVAAAIVQAINRIKCRKIDEYGNTPKTDIYIINKDEKLDELIRIAMPDVNISYDWEFEYNPNLFVEGSNNIKKKQEPLNRLIEFLKDVINNPERVAEYKELGYIDDKGLKIKSLKSLVKLRNQRTWKEVKNDNRFILFCKANGLELGYNHLEFK